MHKRTSEQSYGSAKTQAMEETGKNLRPVLVLALVTEVAGAVHL